MRKLALALSAMGLPTAALAEFPPSDPITFATAGLAYTTLTDGDDSFNQTNLFGEVEFDTGTVFGSAGLSYSQLSGDDASDIDFTIFDAVVGYSVTPTIGLYVSYLTIDGDISDSDLYGIGAVYDDGRIEAGFEYLRNDDDDFDVYGLYGGYRIDDALRVYGSALSQSESDETFYVLGADYKDAQIEWDFALLTDSGGDESFVFGDVWYYLPASAGVRLGGTVTYFFDDNDDFGQYRIGAGYEVADSVWVDAFYGNFFGNDGPSEDVYSLGLSLTLELGDRPSARNQTVLRQTDLFETFFFF